MAQNGGTKKSKKEQFTRQPGSKLPLVVIIVVAITAGIIAAAAGGVFSRGGEKADEGGFYGELVAQPRSYVGRYVSMTNLEPEVDSEWVTFPLAQLEEYEIVYFEVKNNEGVDVPLMAYLTPSGRLFAGSSMCEPCRGRYFSLAGETIVCETCRTTYTIEDHKFLSGSPACGSYPPVYMNPQVENGLVKIPMSEIRQWRIRA